MNTRRQLCFCLILFLLTPASGLLAAESSARPNIILIMCDDMGFSDIGCFGSEIDTPNIDSLASDGLTFTQFYNNAKCTTTRASLITGMYPRQSGGLLRPDLVTIPEVLRPAGYRCALSGKWHLGSKQPNRPSDRGFHEYYGLLDGCCNFFDPAQPDPKFKGGRVRFFAHNDVRITEFPKDYYTTDAFTDYAVDFIDRTVTQDKSNPFFLHVCYTAPHYPLHALPEDIAKYRGKYSAGWEALRAQRHQKQAQLGLFNSDWTKPGLNREVKPWADAPHKDWQDLRMATYAAMIDRMDQGIGRILKSLDKHNISENTVVMFLSDNGGCAETPGGENPATIPGPKEFYAHCGPGWAWAQNTPFRRYKQWVHEGGISTPFLVRWPAATKVDSKTNAVGHIIDVLPTCAELAGIKVPETFKNQKLLPMEGLSLLPLFKGKTRTGHQQLCWEWSGSRAIREGDWKLCWDRGVKRWELYNMQVDRTETRDLADKHPDRVQDLSSKWMTWAKRTGVKNRKQ